MLKVPSKLSCKISTVLSVLLFFCCVAAIFLMPQVTELLIDARNHVTQKAAIVGMDRVVVLVLAYFALTAVFVADVLLFRILRKVRESSIFSASSIALVRGVSWCCFALSAVFIALGFYFVLSFAVALLAAFLGLCLRVVKNVLEEATEIKSENDLTV